MFVDAVQAAGKIGWLSMRIIFRFPHTRIGGPQGVGALIVKKVFHSQRSCLAAAGARITCRYGERIRYRRLWCGSFLRVREYRCAARPV